MILPPLPAQNNPSLVLLTMDSGPDQGEDHYRDFGCLPGKNAFITGGDAGIGRSVAIAYAREGDVLIAY